MVPWREPTALKSQPVPIRRPKHNRKLVFREAPGHKPSRLLAAGSHCPDLRPILAEERDVRSVRRGRCLASVRAKKMWSGVGDRDHPDALYVRQSRKTAR